MHRNLETRMLRTFIAVVDRGGFRRAANALHISQSAVSQQMQQLDSQVGGTGLFRTTRNPLRLSRTGEELLGYARRIVTINDDAVSRLVPVAVQGNLKLGMSEQLAPAMSEMLLGLSRRPFTGAPRVEMAMSEPLAARVRRSELDAALVLRPVKDPVQEKALGEVNLSWYGREAAVRRWPLPVALFSEPCNLRSHVQELLRSCEMAWQVVYEGDHLAGLVAAVRSAWAVACLISGEEERAGLPTVQSDLLPAPGRLPLSLVLRPQLEPELGAAIAASARRALRVLPVKCPAAD